MPDTRPLRALVWAAVSTKPQTERDSISDQLSDGRAYAQRMGWQVSGELTVPGESREFIFFHEASAEVSAYGELARLAEDHVFDVLICRGRDRLGRTDALIAQVEAILSRSGAQVLSLAMPQPMTGTADRGALYVAAIERAGAQAEIVELRRRHGAGMRGRVLRGEHPKGMPPYPWRRGSDGRPELPPENLTVARRIFDLYVHQHYGYDRITGVLNSERIPSPSGSTWCFGSVRRVLVNPWNRGLVRYGHATRNPDDVQYAPSNYAAIYNEDEVAMIETEASKRLRFRKGFTSTPHPWTGLIFCGRCHHAMHIAWRKGGRHAYRCSHHERQLRAKLPGCHNNHTRIEKIESAAIAALEPLVAQLDSGMVLAVRDAGRTAGLQADLDAATSAIGRLDTERERLLTLYLRGTVDVADYERHAGLLTVDLDAQRKAAALARRQLHDVPDPALRQGELTEYTPRLLTLLRQGTTPELRPALHRVFRRIFCEDCEVVRVVL